MILTSKHHFYAAHRNAMLDDQCQFLHGHTYHLELGFNFRRLNDAGVTMLFKDVEEKAGAVIKKYDHATIIDIHDGALMECATSYPKIFGKVMHVSGPTSLENLAKQIFTHIVKEGLPLDYIQISETTTKSIIYRLNG